MRLSKGTLKALEDLYYLKQKGYIQGGRYNVQVEASLFKKGLATREPLIPTSEPSPGWRPIRITDLGIKVLEELRDTKPSIERTET